MSGGRTDAGVWSPQLPIETERLILRGHRRDDLDDLVVFHGDPEVTRFIPWPVRTREETAAALERKLAATVVSAEGDWLVLAVEERASGRVIGEVLLKRSDDANRLGEVGYAFATTAQGRGLAGEAVRVILELADGALGLRTVVAHVEPGNTASSRLLDRLGFQLDAVRTVDAAGVELLGYRREPPLA